MEVKRMCPCDKHECYEETCSEFCDRYREDVTDSYRKQIKCGFYTATIYQDENGDYHYNHPSGGD